MKFGEKLARRLAGGGLWAHKRKTALILGLKGDLGAGKTTFVQGFFRGLGLKKRAPSPTFVIMRKHALKHRKFSKIFHVDAYRLKNASALKTLGFGDILSDPRNVVLIEWADRAKKILPKDAVWLRFLHGKRENERHIIISQ